MQIPTLSKIFKIIDGPNHHRPIITSDFISIHVNDATCIQIAALVCSHGSVFLYDQSVILIRHSEIKVAYKNYYPPNFVPGFRICPIIAFGPWSVPKIIEAARGFLCIRNLTITIHHVQIQSMTRLANRKIVSQLCLDLAEHYTDQDQFVQPLTYNYSTTPLLDRNNTIHPRAVRTLPVFAI